MRLQPSHWRIGRDRVVIDADTVARALELEGRDDRGLGPLARRAEALVTEHGRLGVSRPSGLLGIPARTYRTVVEPALLRAGAVRSTLRGLRPA